jgi:hypothetical protein
MKGVLAVSLMAWGMWCTVMGYFFPVFLRLLLQAIDFVGIVRRGGLRDVV